jgi:hypothetical protein
MRGPPPQHGAAALRFFGVILVAQKNWAQKTGHKKLAGLSPGQMGSADRMRSAQPNGFVN